MQRTLAIANYFIKKSEYTVTPLQLVKLVYIAYGYVLAIMNRKLFSEDIEAWQFGPVVPSIYHTFKHYKKEPIKELSSEITFDENFHFNEQIFQMDQEDQNYEIIKQILDKVWEKYKKYNAYQLIDLTHTANSPWSEVFEPGTHHIKIQDDLIKNHYLKLLTE